MALSPAAQVRIILGEFRKRGYEFDDAWTQTMRALPRGHPDMSKWRKAIEFARPHYEAAYMRASVDLAKAEAEKIRQTRSERLSGLRTPVEDTSASLTDLEAKRLARAVQSAA